jgi:hypothetical protein
MIPSRSLILVTVIASAAALAGCDAKGGGSLGDRLQDFSVNVQHASNADDEAAALQAEAARDASHPVVEEASDAPPASEAPPADEQQELADEQQAQHDKFNAAYAAQQQQVADQASAQAAADSLAIANANPAGAPAQGGGEEQPKP